MRQASPVLSVRGWFEGDAVRAKQYDPARVARSLWKRASLWGFEQALRDAYAAGQAACRVTFEARQPRSPRGTTPPSGER